MMGEKAMTDDGKDGAADTAKPGEVLPEGEPVAAHVRGLWRFLALAALVSCHPHDQDVPPQVAESQWAFRAQQSTASWVELGITRDIVRTETFSASGTFTATQDVNDSSQYRFHARDTSGTYAYHEPAYRVLNNEEAQHVPGWFPAYEVCPEPVDIAIQEGISLSEWSGATYFVDAVTLGKHPTDFPSEGPVHSVATLSLLGPGKGTTRECYVDLSASGTSVTTLPEEPQNVGAGPSFNATLEFTSGSHRRSRRTVDIVTVRQELASISLECISGCESAHSAPAKAEPLSDMCDRGSILDECRAMRDDLLPTCAELEKWSVILEYDDGRPPEITCATADCADAADPNTRGGMFAHFSGAVDHLCNSTQEQTVCSVECFGFVPTNK
jgi:hypothetical protein